MILRSIELENFGLYAGRQRLDLVPRRGRPVVLLGGRNGAGKTTLLDAVRLALYGRRSLGYRTAQSEYEDHLRTRVHAGPDGRVAGVASVGLEFDYAEGRGHPALPRQQALVGERQQSRRDAHLGEGRRACGIGPARRMAQLPAGARPHQAYRSSSSSMARRSRTSPGTIPTKAWQRPCADCSGSSWSDGCEPISVSISRAGAGARRRISPPGSSRRSARPVRSTA